MNMNLDGFKKRNFYVEGLNYFKKSYIRNIKVGGIILTKINFRQFLNF